MQTYIYNVTCKRTDGCIDHRLDDIHRLPTKGPRGRTVHFNGFLFVCTPEYMTHKYIPIYTTDKHNDINIYILLYVYRISNCIYNVIIIYIFIFALFTVLQEKCAIPGFLKELLPLHQLLRVISLFGYLQIRPSDLR